MLRRYRAEVVNVTEKAQRDCVGCEPERRAKANRSPGRSSGSRMMDEIFSVLKSNWFYTNFAKVKLNLKKSRKTLKTKNNA